MNDGKQKALILGMHGGFGSVTARALQKRGFEIHALTRRQTPAFESGVHWIRGDARNVTDVVHAAREATVIVHAAHPARYLNWREHGMPMLTNVIEAAKRTGATVVFPGNVYNFGPDAGSVLREDSPQRPLTRKGAIRVEMEEMLRAAGQEGVRTIVLRCGDFFGPARQSSWFSQLLVKPGKPVTKVPYPGVRLAGHSWAYLPDVAEAVAGLLMRRHELAPFEVFHFAGHWLPRGVQMAETICDVAGIPYSRIGGFPWWALTAVSPFVKTFREMLEMRYLWQRPLALDNRKLVAVLGREPHTPLHQAVRDSLAALDCLDGVKTRASPDRLTPRA